MLHGIFSQLDASIQRCRYDYAFKVNVSNFKSSFKEPRYVTFDENKHIEAHEKYRKAHS
jgi:hypothetical protein